MEQILAQGTVEDLSWRGRELLGILKVVFLIMMMMVMTNRTHVHWTQRIDTATHEWKATTWHRECFGLLDGGDYDDDVDFICGAQLN